MVKPTESILRAIINLENNGSWNEIISWVDKSLLTQSIRNNHSVGEDIIRNQGRALELEELLKYINKAHEYLGKIHETNKREG